MVETHLTAIKPELYDRLIDRLGLALDAMRTSVHLRNEVPAELELKGLSRAEFDWLKAYLHASAANVPAPVVRAVAERGSNVLWLKDRRRRGNRGGAQAMPFE
ncbi:hypothetical protein [Pseudomonas sp. RIT-PI-S]|uniref:hypothetical protein n=1 Tax=Pseudomonas sp. RIT-PI-S TaxID=3035295 RepID=UPI0021D93111|nr:hypothetical protein [Pseudomonas sp. RIT-PI-S]